MKKLKRFTKALRHFLSVLRWYYSEIVPILPQKKESEVEQTWM